MCSETLKLNSSILKNKGLVVFLFKAAGPKFCIDSWLKAISSCTSKFSRATKWILKKRKNQSRKKLNSPQQMGLEHQYRSLRHYFGLLRCLVEPKSVGLVKNLDFGPDLEYQVSGSEVCCWPKILSDSKV